VLCNSMRIFTVMYSHLYINYNDSYIAIHITCQVSIVKYLAKSDETELSSCGNLDNLFSTVCDFRSVAVHLPISAQSNGLKMPKVDSAHAMIKFLSPRNWTENGPLIGAVSSTKTNFVVLNA
jgi:hypothetical protein